MPKLEPLRREHRELAPHVEAVRAVADRVGTVPADELTVMVEDVLTFLLDHLVPHARAEEVVLYPLVDQALGSPGATATMTREHAEVAHLTDELQRLHERQVTGEPVRETDLRRVLYSVYAIVRLHFAKEEDLYLPLLEASLTAEQADEMFTAMHQAAQGPVTARA